MSIISLLQKNTRKGDIIMSKIRKLDLPDVRECIYSTSTRLAATQKYIKELESFSSLEAKLLRNKLETDYLRYISNYKLQRKTKRIFTKVHEESVRFLLEHSVTTKSREKSLLSYIYKNLIALSTNKPLDKIMDTRACRIIIDSPSKNAPEELLKSLGNLVNHILSYLLDLGFQLCPAPPPKDTNKFNPNNNQDIYIPKSSYILPEFKIYVKDYVTNPKENGYQSFHVIVIDSDGDPFEIQFRTYDMDCYSEEKLASHDTYKEKQIKKYNLPILDRTKIHWSNYRYEIFKIVLENGEIVERTLLADDAGLEKSLSICTITHNP